MNIPLLLHMIQGLYCCAAFFIKSRSYFRLCHNLTVENVVTCSCFLCNPPLLDYFSSFVSPLLVAWVFNVFHACRLSFTTSSVRVAISDSVFHFSHHLHRCNCFIFFHSPTDCLKIFHLMRHSASTSTLMLQALRPTLCDRTGNTALLAHCGHASIFTLMCRIKHHC